jgi:hypothetical protein
VRKAGVTGIDDTVESVFRLDACVSNLWPGGLTDQEFNELMPTIGAYLGDMMVRHLGGRWVTSHLNPIGLTVYFDGEGDVDPFKPVLERLRGNDDQAIAKYFVAVRLAQDARAREQSARAPSLLDRLRRRR